MSNIAYNKSIRTRGEYIDLAEAMGITFTLNSKYQIQLLNSAMVMISDTKPTEGGFFIFVMIYYPAPESFSCYMY